MSNSTHQTEPTQFVEAAGARFAYRRFAGRLRHKDRHAQIFGEQR
jgi:hypothetical protein